MPLAFESISHGTIAFGFFNIRSDMLLLEHYFFFARDFCRHISTLAEREGGLLEETGLPVFHIPAREDIGDLMGAIHGVRFSGFMGDIYRKFPFPERQEDFKQDPEGYRVQEVMRGIIEGYAMTMEITFSLDPAAGVAEIGEYHFTRRSFQALLLYVWEGGYPGWRDHVRPGYVVDMKETVEAHPHGLFRGISFP